MAKSSTISQPTAIRPFMVSRAPRASRARSSTTVLATDSARPKTSDPPKLQPQPMATLAPSKVATPICSTAPGNAIFCTSSRSSSEKCRPTPNISSITPISASSFAIPASPTKPGVNGPMRIPANKYPTRAGSFIRTARKPSTRDRPSAVATVVIRGRLWEIKSPSGRAESAVIVGAGTGTFGGAVFLAMVALSSSSACFAGASCGSSFSAVS